MEEKKLISMTEYVLNAFKLTTEIKDACLHNAEQLRLIINYANFLKRPLELGFFIPTDKEGNVLEKPKDYDEFMDSVNSAPKEYDLDISTADIPYFEYLEAKQRVLFEGFSVLDLKQGFSDDLQGVGFMIDKDNHFCVFWKSNVLDWYLSRGLKNIEDLILYNLTLTDNALKQLN